MRAKELINYLIPPLKPEDTIDQALQWMEEFRLSELPVADNEEFLGVVSEEMLMALPAVEAQISDLQLVGQETLIRDTRHFYEVLRVAYSTNRKVVAVLDEYDRYIGAISVEDVVEAFAKTSTIQHPGAILVIETNNRDYYLSEISRIVESVDLKILSSYIVSREDDPTKIELTIKINKEDTSHVISMLDANGYKVVESFSQSQGSMMEKDRLDQLLNFLKI
ncbi:MAG: CBS domain-containing protein [Cytophagales bacterium]|nr:CBS domain-containing protein [Cytophagales bacterium]